MSARRKDAQESAPNATDTDDTGLVGAIPANTNAIAGWPVARHGSRELVSILRRLLDIVTDRRSSMHPYLWANHVVALGKLVDSERDAVLSDSVLHNIGQRRTDLLNNFIQHWDSINAVDVLKVTL